MDLRSITEDSEAYKRCHDTYLRNTKKLENTKSYLSGDFVQYLRQLQPVDKRPLRYLTIGSGNGEKDISILRQLRVLYPSHAMEVTVVEPVAEHLSEFQKLVSLEELSGKVTFDWRQETGELFRLQQISTEYDVIVCLESLYYETDMKTTIAFFCDLLLPSGILVISICKTNNGLMTLQREFSARLPVHVAVYGADDIRKIILALGNRFDEIAFPNDLPVNAVFDKDSQEGAEMTDFISHTANFRREVPADLQQKFLDRLKSEDLCKVVDGNYFLLMDYVYLIIFKDRK